MRAAVTPGSWFGHAACLAYAAARFPLKQVTWMRAYLGVVLLKVKKHALQGLLIRLKLFSGHNAAPLPVRVDLKVM